uniref:Major sperm protein n=1 Tax=Caenorhabditis japonica TaxID=281687 RepID=A0A8R1DIR9_CAEJA
MDAKPNSKVSVYAPNHTYDVKLVNSSLRRIGYGINAPNMTRRGMVPSCGVLAPRQSVRFAVSCDAFSYGRDDTNNDRITIEWTNAVDGAGKQFRREWFKDGALLHEVLAVYGLLRHFISLIIRKIRKYQKKWE